MWLLICSCSYYGFDKEVIREILGKRMNAKLRKDMDDVCEKTGIPLKRCRRQVSSTFREKINLSEEFAPTIGLIWGPVVGCLLDPKMHLMMETESNVNE